MAQQRIDRPEELDEFERQRLADEFMADWNAWSEEVRRLPPEDQDRFIRELTEAIDEGIRSRVERLDRAASRDRDL